jgi:hypothetical protein
MCDMLESMMEIEERFGVTIPDERAEKFTTVGDLYLYLLGQTRRRARTPCPTSQAFYRLRRTLTGEFGVDRGRVRPATRLRALFPAAARSTTWPRLAAALGLPDLPDWPRRRVPSARVFAITLAWAMAAWWLIYLLLLFFSGEDMPITFGLLIWFLVALLVCEGFGIAWIVGSLDYLGRIRVPRVRHLVVRLVLQQPDRNAGTDAAEPSPRAVWADLVTILGAQTGGPAQEIRPEDRFTELPCSC